MIVKALLAAALVAVPFPVAPSIPLSIDSDAIPKVVCPVFAGPVLRGISYGSAFRVGGNLLISVRHVTHEGNCMVDGMPIQKLWESDTQDFAIFTATPGPRVPIDCGGYVKGRRYVAVGHARGLDQLTAIELVGTGVKAGQFSLLVGTYTVIPGQSGAAILDAETGAAVGTINAYDMAHGISFSVALRDTPICGHA